MFCILEFYILFTNIPDMVSDISVLGRNQACMSDHFGVQFETNLNISYRKMEKRTIFNYSKADWKSIHFELRKIN